MSVCGEGTLLPDAFFTDPLHGASAGDPAGTDTFGTNGTFTTTFDVALMGLDVLSATISAKTVGLERFGGIFGDAFQGARLQFNGLDVATFFTPGGDPAIGAAGPANRVGFISFALDAGTILDGTNSLTLIPEEAFEPFDIFEEYAVDFTSLTVVTGDPAPVIPLPAAIWMLGGAIALLGARGRIGART